VSQRRQQILDAALRVLGTDGARGLTYQAVDGAADVPAGTTSNYFRTRRALLHAATQRILELDQADWDRFTRDPPSTVEGAVAALTGLVHNAADLRNVPSRARFALFLEAASRPELAELLAGGRAAILEWGTQWLSSLGITEPARVYQQLAAHLDGMILHRITFPTETLDPAPGIRALLQGAQSGEDAEAGSR
jgi:DNA-binding transcriptional regulator YbjK